MSVMFFKHAESAAVCLHNFFLFQKICLQKVSCLFTVCAYVVLRVVCMVCSVS